MHSTSTVRLAGSTGANPYACIAAGISVTLGTCYGGANEAVLKMLDEIGTVENVAGFMEKVKTKEVKLMGFGHRVYKNFDPRAKVMKETCDEVLVHWVSTIDSLLWLWNLNVLRFLMNTSSNVTYTLNVDFYSGIILKAIGIPTRNVYCNLRACTYCWLDQPLVRNAQRPLQNRSSSSALHWRSSTRHPRSLIRKN